MSLFWVLGATAFVGTIPLVVGFVLTDEVAGSAPALLAFAAGAFVYIASSDLIPEIKRDTRRGRSVLHFAVFAAGLVVMWVLTFVEPPV